MFNYFNLGKSKTMLNKYKEGEKIELEGICKSVVFKSEESDYGVYNFETISEDSDVRFKVQGSFTNGLIEGQSYKLKGKVINYKGEKQLRIFEYFISKPINKKGIISYLQTLHGLKKKAELIYDEFGDECINILLKDPFKISNKIKGIGKKSVTKWQTQLKSLEENQETVIKLLGYGISANNVNKLIKEFKDDTLPMVEKNPYILAEKVRGFGFLKCDNIALNVGLLPNDENRIKSSITYVLEEAATNGHCYLPSEELIDNIYDLLNLKLTYIEMVELLKTNLEEEIKLIKYDREYIINRNDLNELVDNYEHKSKKDKNNYRYIYHSVDKADIGNQINKLISENGIINDNGNIYLKRLYFAELGFAKNIKRLSNYKKDHDRKTVEKILDEICKEKGYVLEYKQRQACIEFNTSNQGVFILNGSAGTGKTFTLNLIIEVAKRLNKYKKKEMLAVTKDTLAVAPTGKASKVASKSIGMECLTIHRALEFNPITGFQKNEDNPFDQTMIVCDEGSMLDIELAYSFIKAIQDGSKFIIMGDIKQLASVGAGNVLKDLIEHSEDDSLKTHYTKVVTLDVIKRQGLLSGIVKAANKVISNQMICTESTTKDFYLLEKNNCEDVRNYVIKSIKRLLTYPNYTFEDIQVLIPQRTGPLGVYAFNYILQKTFNPYVEGFRIFKTSFDARIYNKIETFELYIQKGDKVIHTKNNYSLNLYTKNELGKYSIIPNMTGVTNGESGVVEDIIKIGNAFRVIVKYEDFYVFYEDGIDELELAYAITIHKSQGSAWKAIILPIVSQHMFMLSNNLIYTGITRARDFCAVIGDKKSIYMGIQTQKDYYRYSGLKDKLIS